MNVLDNILAKTRADIDALRAESADEAREATAISERMAEPTDAYRDAQAEEAELVRKLEALRGHMKTAKSALDAMATERDRHARRADQAADAADHYEQVTLPHMAALLDGVPPHEQHNDLGLMREEPKQVPRDGNGRVIPPPGKVVIDSGPVSAEIYQDNGLPMVWSNAAAPGGYVCAMPPTDAGGLTLPDGTRVCGMPVESEPCDQHNPPPVNIARTPDGVGAVLAPPVPDEPVATHGPTTTMPDTGLAPPRLDPPPGDGVHSHAKPSDGLMSRVTGGFKTLIGRDEQPDDEQDGDQQ